MSVNDSQGLLQATVDGVQWRAKTRGGRLPVLVSIRAVARLEFAVPVAVWLASALYVWSRLDRGWWPHDEGTIAQGTERVLNGQLPHRDFGDAYTGGLSYVHAFAFWAFGTELTSLRLVLFGFFLAWVPAVYYVASRFLGPPAAGAVVLVAVSWSVPNYTASMPSWYNTFLAVFGTAALLRHLETERRRWLFVAGLCGGASLAIKVVGLYFILAVLVYLLFREQSLRLATAAGAPARRSTYGTLVSLFALALASFGLLLIRSRFGPGEVVNFLVPVASLAAFVLWSEYRTPGGEDRARARNLLTLVVPFGAGVIVPIGLFLIPYVASGAVGDLVDGAFITPMRRVDFAALSPPSPATLLALIPLAALLGFARSLSGRSKATEWLAAAALVFVLGAALVGVRRQPLMYWLTWQSLRAIVPFLTLGGLAVLASRRRKDTLDSPAAQRLVLLLSVATMCSLVQFPFAAPVYFSYVAPLVIVAAVAVVVYGALIPRLALWALIAFYLAFAVARMNPDSLIDLGQSYQRADLSHLLTIDRGGLAVGAGEKAEYERLVDVVRSHAGASKYIYAGPDSPEVYFLAGLENPTPTLFEFLDNPVMTQQRLLVLLADHNVSVIAINRRPAFSGQMAPALRRALETRYPSGTVAGRFLVRWRA